MAKKYSYVVFLLLFVLLSTGIEASSADPLPAPIITKANSRDSIIASGNLSIDALMTLIKINPAFSMILANNSSHDGSIQFYKFFHQEARGVVSPTTIYIVFDLSMGTGAAIIRMRSATYYWNNIGQEYLTSTCTLSREQCENLSSLISTTRFFDIDTLDSLKHPFFDGSTWTIEMISGNQYNVVNRSTPEYKDGRDGCAEIYAIGMLIFDIVDYWTLLDNNLQNIRRGN